MLVFVFAFRLLPLSSMLLAHRKQLEARAGHLNRMTSRLAISDQAALLLICVGSIARSAESETG